MYSNHIVLRLLTIGFAVGILGWLIAAVTDHDQVGIGLFFIGWVLAAIGVIAGNLRLIEKNDTHKRATGMLLATIGFAISCVSVGIEYLFKLSNISQFLFNIGFIIVIVGIIFHMIHIIKK